MKLISLLLFVSVVFGHCDDNCRSSGAAEYRDRSGNRPRQSGDWLYFIYFEDFSWSSSI